MFRLLMENKGWIAIVFGGLIWLMLDARALAAAVAITSPAGGSNVSGTVTVTLTNGSGVSWSNVYVDDVYQNSTPPTFFYWHTTGVANGQHTLSAIAFDRNGNNLGSTSETVDVANGNAVSLTSPSNGATVSGPVTIGLANGSATSWSNLYINGQYEISTPPTSFVWQTTAVRNGQYQISATAFDAHGNNLGSAQTSVTVANGAAPSASSGAVTLTSPSNGSTVNGTVNIAASEGAGVGWLNYYVDGNYLKSSPPLSFSWNSGSVSNGNHTISAIAFNSSKNELGSSSTAVTVQNSSVASSSHFYTLPPGSSLPSGSVCASAVRRNPNFEPRPDNYTANHTVPSDNLTTMRTSSKNGGAPPHTYDRVDGNFTGTTDEILQWGACKWGFDEDLVRAIAADETWWHQSGHGDLTSNTSLCPSGAIWTGSECALSYGIMQVKSSDYAGTFPDSHTSTAFDIDYKLAYQRACFEGKVSYLTQRSSNYPNGNQDNMLWGCVDQWNTGTWWNGSDDSYLTEVKGEMSSKPWLKPGF